MLVLECVLVILFLYHFGVMHIFWVFCSTKEKNLYFPLYVGAIHDFRSFMFHPSIHLPRKSQMDCNVTLSYDAQSGGRQARNHHKLQSRPASCICATVIRLCTETYALVY